MSRPSTRWMPALIQLGACGALMLLASGAASAQTTESAVTVPQVLPVTGTIVGPDGKPLNGTTAVTFTIYDEAEGGTPLWVEVQQITFDDHGRFTAWLGSQGQSLPLELFQTGLARWMGVQPAGLPEQPRARFLAVPYALKALDAETLGGLPASAFLQAQQSGALTTGGQAPASRQAARGRGADSDAGAGAAADTLHADATYIQDSVCVGVDCVNGEAFSFDTVRLKENNTRLTFMDTSVGSFPNRDWRLRANSSVSGGQNAFYIDDMGSDYTTGAETPSSTPFTIEAAAPNNTFYIDSSGRIGFRTASPVLDLHVATSNTPGMRLEQTSAGGFSAQTWDIASNETSFFIRDVTSGSRLPFRIRPGAPSSSIDIGPTGNVGVGVITPSAKLAVDGDIDTTNGSDRSLTLRSSSTYNYVLKATGDDFQILEAGTTPRIHIDYPGGKVGINTTSPSYQLHVNGTLGVNNDATIAGNIDTTNGANRSVTLRSATNYNYVMKAVGDDFEILEAGVTPRIHIDYPGGNIGLGTTSPTHPLEMASGAYVSAAGVWTNASSRTLKDHITDLTSQDAWAAFLRLKPVTFVYKADPSDLQVGFIAEDVPALVASADRRGLSAMDITAVLTKVVQDQQQTIERLQQQIDALTAMVEKLTRERQKQ